MPRDLFQIVLERVRAGTWRQMSRPRNAQVATSSASSTILPIVALSRALTRLLMPPGFDFLFAITNPFLVVHSLGLMRGQLPRLGLINQEFLFELIAHTPER